MIFNIQRCSIHDGEGLRTHVFFKGCPLRCAWCANPESQSYEREIMESPIRCVGCGACRQVCPSGAVTEKYIIDREKCGRCFRCTDVCYAEAKRVAGREYTLEELIEEIEKDRPFYRLYGGGVTFSGGEPLTHGKYLAAAAMLCRQKGINVTVESCGYGNRDDFKEALPYIDAMFIDIKHIDSDRHREMTGVGNEEILKNISYICAEGMPVTIRTPVVPGRNDSRRNIECIARYISGLKTVREYELLPYHNFGESKYVSLGKKYALTGINPPEEEDMNRLVKIANEILNDHGKTAFWTKNNNREVII